MSKEKIIVLMGSPKDLQFAAKIKDFIKKENFSVITIFNVASAHRTPDKLLTDLQEYEAKNKSIVYITVAGLSDALSGVVAGFTRFPVIACPPDSEKYGAMKIFSSTAMPKGIPVAYIANPENAALTAIRIFALENSLLQEQLKKFKQKMTKSVYDGAEEVRKITRKKDINRLTV